ncbi:88 kda immunoreactive mannoprotein mp88 [Gigaspora margarita]|uniref:88 kDa immunoreactive mannoprotein mp88 n=1 Tax=Gigaspora margarita TaxID=4874 RepID=A0A8H4A3C9_GIGMA|nr:88 kda immunoreactive mannoprotein mp88 [Gigaspora margarita]
MAKLSILLFILAVITYVHAVAVNLKKQKTHKTPKNQKSLDLNDPNNPITVTVQSEDMFCLFLPRNQGQDIGSSEVDAIAFCNNFSPNAPNARIFPDGLIKTMCLGSGPGYVQMTGLIDGNVYLNATDGGGQYDINAPSGAVCHGYDSFVNLIEPNNGRFCIRCCDSSATSSKMCDTSRSTDGCVNIIQGKYEDCN